MGGDVGMGMPTPPMPAPSNIAQMIAGLPVELQDLLMLEQLAGRGGMGMPGHVVNAPPMGGLGQPDMPGDDMLTGGAPSMGGGEMAPPSGLAAKLMAAMSKSGGGPPAARPMSY